MERPRHDQRERPGCAGAVNLASASKSLARNRKSCTGVAATKGDATLASRQGGDVMPPLASVRGQANSGRASGPASFNGARAITPVQVCSICGGPIVGFGNNARPVNDGDRCNERVVVSALLERIRDADTSARATAATLVESTELRSRASNSQVQACCRHHAENSDHRDCAAADVRHRAAIPATTATETVRPMVPGGLDGER